MIQVYKHKATGQHIIVFRHIRSRALNCSTLQAITFDYKGFILKENSLNIYYTRVKIHMLSSIYRNKYKYIVAGYKP